MGGETRCVEGQATGKAVEKANVGEESEEGRWPRRRPSRSARAAARAGLAAELVGRQRTKRMRTVIILCNTNNLNSYEFYSCATTYFPVLSMMVDARLK
jgi:hypothetical protein